MPLQIHPGPWFLLKEFGFSVLVIRPTNLFNAWISEVASTKNCNPFLIYDSTEGGAYLIATRGSFDPPEHFDYYLNRIKPQILLSVFDGVSLELAQIKFGSCTWELFDKLFDTDIREYGTIIGLNPEWLGPGNVPWNTH